MYLPLGGFLRCACPDPHLADELSGLAEAFTICKKIEILFKNKVRDNNRKKEKMAYAVQIKLEELEKENASIRKDNESIRKENAELRHIITSHAGQIERNKNALCQLFGGLYNPTYQKRILKQHLVALLGSGAADEDDEAEDDEEDDEEDDAEPLEDSCPTTRQGDAHETRLKESEERLRQLEAQIDLMEKRQLEKFGFNMWNKHMWNKHLWNKHMWNKHMWNKY